MQFLSSCKFLFSSPVLKALQYLIYAIFLLLWSNHEKILKCNVKISTQWIKDSYEIYELSKKMLVNIWLLELNVGRSNIDLKVDNYTSLEKLQANLK